MGLILETLIDKNLQISQEYVFSIDVGQDYFVGKILVTSACIPDQNSVRKKKIC